jgi:tetratricopeptide (TPR) repeat protein
MATLVPESAARGGAAGHKWARALIVVVLLALAGFGVFLVSAHFYCSRNFNDAQRAMEVGDYRRAEECLQRSLWVWSGKGEVHFYLARAFRMQLQLDRAQEELAECRRLGWSEANIDLIDLEETLLSAQQGEFPALEQRLIEWASKDGPDAAPVQEALCLLYLNREQLGPAQRWGEKFLECFPKSVPTLLRMGKIHSLNFNSLAALEHFRRAAAVAPDDDDIKTAYAEAFLKFKEPARALPLYQDLGPRFSQSRSIQLGLARCYRELGQLDACRPILSRLADRYPEDVDILFERGRLAQQQGKLAEAVTWLRRVVASEPFDHRPYFALYQCLLQLKDASPDEIDRLLAKHDEIKKLEDRWDHLIRVEISRNPFQPEVYYELAVMYTRFNRDQEAAAYMNRALGHLPLNPLARAELVDRMVRKRIAAWPTQPAAYFAAAWACKLTGRNKEAAAYARKTIEIEPSHRGAHQHLADYYAGTGDAVRAAYHARLAAAGNRPKPQPK